MKSLSESVVNSEAALGELAVCIATYNRVDRVLNLLAELDKIERPTAAHWTRTVVVDNSPDANARTPIGDFSGMIPVIYVHEPTPGLSAARNCLVRSAKSDLIAFIDDDELPSKKWLVELTNALSRHPDAVAVMGPVQFDFEGGASPRWLEQTRLFEPIDLTEGEAPIYLATGNLLLRTKLTETLGELFDPQFGLTGGEDHQLGLRIDRAGLRVVSAPKAEVREAVPKERLSPRWARRRLMRKGASMATTELSLEASMARCAMIRVQHFAKGCLRLVLSSGQILSTPLVQNRTWWYGGRNLFMGLGQIAGAFSLAVKEYRR